MRRMCFLVGITLAYCCALGEKIDWNDEVEKFMTKLDDIWGTGNFELFDKEIYVCDPVRLAPGVDVSTDPEENKQIHSGLYADGYTSVNYTIRELMPTGDRSVIFWADFAFINQDGPSLLNKGVYFLVNQFGKIKLKLFMYN